MRVEKNTYQRQIPDYMPKTEPPPEYKPEPGDVWEKGRKRIALFFPQTCGLWSVQSARRKLFGMGWTAWKSAPREIDPADLPRSGWKLIRKGKP